MRRMTGSSTGGAETEEPRRERMGVLGGTFDPPHRGHVALAEAARRGFDLDVVLFVVAGDPWQKRGQVEATARDRLAMTEAMAALVDGADVWAGEVEREGPTYTAETLERLAESDRDLFLIVGADVASELDTWHEPERVRAQATVLVAGRPDDAPSADEVVDRLRAEGWRSEVVDMEAVPVSSTELRERLRNGQPVAPWVPPQVVRVIHERGLYTRRR